MNDNNTLVVAELHYKDPETALEWLDDVFGLKTRIVVKDQHDEFVFSEVEIGGISIAVLPETGDRNLSPIRTGGVNTQSVRIRADIDVKAHCANARARNAEIIQEPEQFFFGDLTYFVADLEGHVWAFAQPIKGKAGPPPEGWTVTISSQSDV